MSQGLEELEKTIRRQRHSYVGKFRGFVVDNADPETRGRIKLRVPSVLGEAATDWALPCMPYGGAEGLGMLHVPPVGAQVFVEFLEGDVSAPVWTGTFWRQSGETPEDYSGPDTKVIRTDSGHVLIFDDTDGEETITLKSTADAQVVMDHEGSLALTDASGGTVILDANAMELTVRDANGNEIVMSASGIDCTDANGNKITATGAGVEIKASAIVNIEGSMVTVAGSGGEPLIKGTSFMSIFNSHTHPTGVGPSGPPIAPMTPAQLTTKSTAQ
jgi:uncharacterized protein involved in type VI secretion and phage assembly